LPNWFRKAAGDQLRRGAGGSRGPPCLLNMGPEFETRSRSPVQTPIIPPGIGGGWQSESCAH
jgi:hypothetical protein